MPEVPQDIPALAVHTMSKSFRRVTAVDCATFTLRAGEHLALLGPNGAGKSTLLKMASGLVRPSEGYARIAGHAVHTRAARSSLGYLGELFRFPSWLTAEQALAMHQRFARSDGGRQERDRLLDRVGLAGAAVRSRRLGHFSKGMQQRLGIAQALVGSPKLVMLDEPTSALDPAGRRFVRELLAELRDSGVSVLLNSHLLGEVERSCDRVLIMRLGVIIKRGTTRELTAARGVDVELASGHRSFPQATRADAPQIVRELVAADEDVVEVHVRQSTLEQAYFDALGDDGGESFE